NGVHIEVAIPSTGVTLVNADGSNGFNCGAPVANVIDCVGDLPAGGNTTLTLNFVTLLAGLPPDVGITATIDPADAFAETDESNNTQTQTTTISPVGTCSMCIDIVASQLLASPEPATAGGAVTVKFQLVNVGDQGTTLNPASQALLYLDSITNGTIGNAIPTSSDPAITCQVDSHGANTLLTSCRGNLGPGQGATITLVIPSVTGSALQITGTGDPTGVVLEANEGNNSLNQTVVVVP
ncbi:MAG TPA: hypothetical protein VFT12_05585, partial [Thermoanaerobaculia bacterium]|nr:hypothetical protein [Thermoanaerobaculia bacterium]